MTNDEIWQFGWGWVGNSPNGDDNKLEKNVRVVVNTETGQIVSVAAGSLSQGQVHHNFPDKILLPGFVNCHSHAFQRGLRGKGEEGGGSFWTWRDGMYKLISNLSDKQSENPQSRLEQFKQHCTRCFQEMRNCGITTVGEFHYFHHGSDQTNARHKYKHDEIILEAAKEAGIRMVLLNAFYGQGGIIDKNMSEAQERFKTQSFDEWRTNFERLQKVELH